MTIQDVKDDPILQLSSHEPSMSSKYGLRGLGVLETHLFLLESWHINQESNIMMIHDVKNDPILQISSQEPSTSYMYDFEEGAF